MNNTLKHYSPLEECLNIGSHALGFVLSLVGLVALLRHAVAAGGNLEIISFGIFGVSLVVTYGISTLYHSTRSALQRVRLRIVDHASIYILIAGTYTPFTLITLQGITGWTIFGISWSMALTGIVLKLFFTGRYEKLSTVMYIVMGWLILFAINPLIDNLAPAGLRWLLAGGVSYTVGALIYSIKKIPLNHAIFHVFVLIGSGCHFITVYVYLI
ncbi:MAG: hemolysin III family protein [Pseudomonadales bacterium]|nr:hemolysin III family protein [Pseudomonadales bacterium]